MEFLVPIQVAPCPQKVSMYKLCPTKLSYIRWHFPLYFKIYDWLQQDRLYCIFCRLKMSLMRPYELNILLANTIEHEPINCSGVDVIYLECEYSAYNCSRETSNTVHRLLVSAFLGHVQRKYPPNRHLRWMQSYANFNVRVKMIKFSTYLTVLPKCYLHVVNTIEIPGNYKKVYKLIICWNFKNWKFVCIRVFLHF